MAWIKYNPNPSGRFVGDCAVRAVSKAINADWEKAYSSIAIQGLTMYDMPNNNAVWGKFLRQKGFRKRPIPDDCPDDYTVRDFCDDHPTGVYVLAVDGHVLTVQDGNYFDSWDSGNELIIYFFERKED